MEKGEDLLNVYLAGLKSGCSSVCFLGVFPRCVYGLFQAGSLLSETEKLNLQKD